MIDLKTVLIVEIACGDTHSILLSNEGIIYTFGKNHRGQLGLNNKTDALIPCVIPSFVGKSFKSVRHFHHFYNTIYIIELYRSLLDIIIQLVLLECRWKINDMIPLHAMT